MTQTRTPASIPELAALPKMKGSFNYKDILNSLFKAQYHLDKIPNKLIDKVVSIDMVAARSGANLYTSPNHLEQTSNAAARAIEAVANNKETIDMAKTFRDSLAGLDAKKIELRKQEEDLKNQYENWRLEENNILREVFPKFAEGKITEEEITRKLDELRRKSADLGTKIKSYIANVENIQTNLDNLHHQAWKLAKKKDELIVPRREVQATPPRIS